MLVVYRSLNETAYIRCMKVIVTIAIWNAIVLIVKRHKQKQNNLIEKSLCISEMLRESENRYAIEPDVSK